MNKKCILITIAGLIFLTMATPCFADKDHRKNPETSSGNAFLFPIEFFRKYMSGADGDRCPMHPSCSTYSLEAFKKHGAIIGWIITCDRLMRCGRNELKLSPPIIARNKERTYDPVSNNDFWWDKPEKP
ncbi:MAG: membrane protein insertion efficiency factor YidD [Desulfobacterales bacterium]